MIVVEAPVGRAAERRHVLDWVLGERLGLAWRLEPGPLGRWTLRRDERAIVMPDLLLGVPDDAWLTPASLPAPPARSVAVAGAWADRLTGERLPVLFGEPGIDAVGPATDETTTLGIDVFGSVFFLITRYEELVVTQRDEHDRFPASASVTGAPALLERPLADDHVGLLAGAIATTWPGLAPATPRGRLLLTHDIDWGRFWQSASPAGTARAAAADLVKRRDPLLAWRRSAAYVAGRAGRDLAGDPLDRFDELMAVAEEHGRQAAFYFVPDRRGHPLDATYDLDDRWVTPALRKIAQRGHEIGLHASYGSHADGPRVRAEADRLRRAVTRAGGEAASVGGGRHHYLRWRNPDSWRAWADAGLAYDSSVGYAEAPGFRSGTAAAHPAFDLARGERIPIEERPLVAMDVTFRTYLGRAAEDAAGRILALARRASHAGGDFVLLWHNTSVVSRPQRRAYRELVASLAPLFD